MLMPRTQVPQGGVAIGSIDFEYDDEEFVHTTSNVAAIGTGDFTLEAWIKPESITDGFHAIMALETWHYDGACLYLRLTGAMLSYIDRTNLGATSAGLITAGTWQHVAMVRSGTSVELFHQGIGQSYGATSSAAVLAGRALVGFEDPDAGNNNKFDGKIALARFSNIARYTGNFTPAVDYGADANTLALIGSFDGGATISEAGGAALTVNGTPVASADAPT